jgi:branched-chain amino acid transport system permease protein
MNDAFQYAVNAISTGGLYGLLALGLSMTFGIARIVNLAQSELIMITCYLILATAAWAWPLIVVAALLGAVVLALAMERFAFRPLRGADETTLLVASFAISLGLQRLMTAIVGDKPKGVGFGSGLSSTVDIFGLDIAKLDLLTIGVTLALLIALAVFLKRTPVGVHLRAAAEDFDMAQLLGVRSQRVVMLAFALSGLTAAVTAIVLTAQQGNLTPTMGIQPLLIGVIAVVVGGMQSLPGAVAGGMLLGIVTVFLSLALPDSLLPFQDAFLYMIVILVLLLRPQGLFIRSSSLERI